MLTYIWNLKKKIKKLKRFLKSCERLIARGSGNEEVSLDRRVGWLLQSYFPLGVANLPRSRGTPKVTQRKTDLDKYPESYQQLVRPWTQVECNPHFCPAKFSGPLNLMVAKPSLRIQNETNKKAVAIPGRERITNQWIPESKFMSHKSKIQFLQMFFACQYEFGKEGTI